MADKEQTPYDRYNAKRVRLCEFSVTGTVARTVEPALDRLAAEHGGKVAAIANAILEADKRLRKKMNNNLLRFAWYVPLRYSYPTETNNVGKQMTTITHHGSNFTIDTMDWSDAQRAEIASNELIKGLMDLSASDVQRVASAWTDVDAECESRNANDDVSEIIESIESAAFSKATKGWESMPDSGHNCTISVSH